MPRIFQYKIPLLMLCTLLPALAQAADPTEVWQTIVTPHFYVHYYKNLRHDERQIAHHAARAAELAHATLSKIFKRSPSTRTHIVVTDDTDGANGSAQILPRNVIRVFVTGPSSLHTLNDYDDWIYGLILHEYAHIMHIDTIFGLARIVNFIFGKVWAPNHIQPSWISEGLAVYFESARTAGGRNRSAIFDMWLRMSVLEGTLLRPDQFGSVTRLFPRGHAGYLYGSRFIQYIVQRFGEQKLIEISNQYGGTWIPYGINKVAKKVLGKTFVELYEDFKKHLQRRYQGQKAAVEARGLTFFRRITDNGESSASPRFSRDGRELVFVDGDGYSQTSIRVLNPLTGETREKFDLFGGSGVDLTPDRKYIIYGHSSFWRTFNSYEDIFVRQRSTGEVRRLTTGLRARDPAVSPDGRQVAFVTNELGTMNLALIPFEGGAHRVLYRGTAGDQVFTPYWSPDGKFIVYSRWREGGNRDIYLLELATSKIQQITDDRALDTDPVFSADGQQIYFSSDRTGIYNVFCYNLVSRGLRQVTNVLGGAFSPTVSPDEKELFYIGFSSRGYDLHAMKLDPERFLPGLPYKSNRPSPPQVAQQDSYVERAYQPWRTILPQSWMFRLGTDYYGSLLGIDLNGQDVVGRHQWALSTNFSLNQWNPSYGLSYVYNGLWPSIILDTSRVAGPRGGLEINGQKLNYLEENYGGGISVSLPVLRVPNHTGSISLGYRFNYFNNADEERLIVEPSMIPPSYPAMGLLSGVTLGLSYSSVQRYAWSISAEKGRQIRIGFRLNHPSLGSDYESVQVTYAWQEYLPLPWRLGHVLALSLGGGIGTGDLRRQGLFSIGGFPEQDVLLSILAMTGMGGAFLRGYPPGTVYGNQYHLLNTEYRFPLWEVERGFSTLPVYLTHLHMAAFVDVGHAFFDEPDLSLFKVGVGAEVFAEAVIGYFLPTTFRMGYARGLMQDGGNHFYFLVGNSF